MASATPQKKNRSRRNVPSSDLTVNAHEKERDYLTEAELELMLKACSESRYPTRDRAILLTMFWHGFRVTELCNLKVADIDFKAGRLHVRRIKKGLSTTHPMRADTMRWLKRHLKERNTPTLPWVFASERGTPFSRKTINYLVASIAKRAKLPLHVHPHMLRHGCGYALGERGQDTRVIQDYLGHRDIKHTTTYTRTSSQRFAEVWD